MLFSAKSIFLSTQEYLFLVFFSVYYSLFLKSFFYYLGNGDFLVSSYLNVEEELCFDWVSINYVMVAVMYLNKIKSCAEEGRLPAT